MSALFAALFHLLFKAAALIDGIVELAERVAHLVTRNEILKPFGEHGIGRLALCKRRILHGIVVYERGLNEVFLHERVEQSRKNVPFGRGGIFELNAQLFRLGARFLGDGRLETAVAMVLAIGPAVIVYFVLVVLLRAITYEDMKLIPKGEKLARILHIK